MSLFDLSNITDDLLIYKKNQRVDLAALRQQVSFAQVVSHFASITPDSKTLCLWHNDHNPSMHIYTNGGYCFSCKQRADIFDYVMVQLKCSFIEAAQWLTDNVGILPSQAVAEKYTTTEYKGPVPVEWVEYWHKQLTDERRDWLLEHRLINSHTIDEMWLGWRPDYAAYVVPFWHGRPGESEIEIVQYRATDKSPTIHGREWRYMGHTGHNRPSVLNIDLVNSELAIVLIGTFDGLLGRQDGLPALSTNGTTAFKDRNRAESKWLRARLSGIKHVFVVPDKTPQEHEQAQELADMLGATVRYFPSEMEGKDYTDYRLAGKTSTNFVEEILGMSMDVLQSVLPTEQVEMLQDILTQMAIGNGQAAFEIMQIASVSVPFDKMRYGLDLLTNRFRETFARDEWNEVGAEFSQCVDYREMAGVIRRWSDKADARRGGF